LIVIPAIDLRGGRVVRGVGGRRERYAPLKSWLCPRSDPLELVERLSSLGFRTVYVADLDAIEREERRHELYRSMASMAKILLDCGVRSVSDAIEAANSSIDVIVATETLPSINVAAKIAERLRCLASIDIRGGRVVSRAPELSGLSPVECARLLSEIGFDTMIAVMLDRVGTYSGVDLGLVESLICVAERLVVGGGIRGLDDLLRLRDMGVHGALVASALHDGKLGVEELRRHGLLGK